MWTFLLSFLAAGLLAAQTGGGPVADTLAGETAVPDDLRSNAYIHEEWSYFAERLRNEHLALAERKFRDQRYDEAVVEYYQFLYNFPEDDIVPLVQYRIGRAYELMQAYDLARSKYKMVRDTLDSDPRLRLVCLRQLAYLDYLDGRYDSVLALPPLDDPYILVLKAFASLTEENWTRSQALVEQAYRFYPTRAQVLLDSLITRLEAIPQRPSYRSWKRVVWSLIPGGGLAYTDQWGEALGHAAGICGLAVGAAVVPAWPRYLMGVGALVLYGVSFESAVWTQQEGNRRLLREQLQAIREDFPLDLFWSFGHPSIY
jgi:tetratricopeptide (TPR) repeat protein